MVKADPTVLNIEGEAREVVRKFKRAERANRDAARSFAQFAERLHKLGIKVELADTEGHSSKEQRQGFDENRSMP